MAIEVKIPSVGESITTGTIATWHQADGAAVRKGDALLTLETDKVSNELEAEGDGVLKILAAEGEEVAIGAIVLCVFGVCVGCHLPRHSGASAALSVST